MNFGSKSSRPIDEQIHKFKLSHAKAIVQNFSNFQNGFKQIHPTQKTSDTGIYNDWQHFQMLTLFQNAQNNMRYLMSVTFSSSETL